MSLVYLEGIPQDMGKLRKRTKAERKADRAERKEERQSKRAEKGGILTKVATVGMAPARLAFLTAVKHNYLRVASRLAKLAKKNPSAFNNFWLKFGGNVNELKEAVSKGSGVAVGMDPVTLSTAVATALPIILAIKKIFAENKVEEEVPASEVDAAEKNMKAALTKDSGIVKKLAMMRPADPVAKVTDDKGVPVKAPVTNDDAPDEESNMPKWLLPVGIGAAALLFMRK